VGKLDGKVALISGTGGGQGRAAAMLFAREGAKVFGCDLKVEGAQQTVELVTRDGGLMRSIQPLDVSEPDQAERWVRLAVEAWGGIDILYNNAGVLKARGPLAQSTIEEWNLTIKHELTSVYVATMAAWASLINRGGGVIINTASISGHREIRPMRSAAHGATKAGVLAMTRMMAAEGAAHKIRTVSISPGMIRSPAIDRFFSGEDARETAIGQTIMSKIPIGRPGTCEEIANVALFLASDDASYINGTDICIDGGLIGLA